MESLEPEALFGPRTGSPLVGSEGEVLRSVTSTMDVARERLKEGAADGYVVVAEHQSAGRGRAGAWECPAGRGLLMSACLRIGLPLAERKLVVLMGAVAAAEAVRRFGVPAQIKWPNDVVVAARRDDRLLVRKLGGLIAETVPRGDAAPAHVLGIGLNVNQGAEDLPQGASVPPTSMCLERGQEVDRTALCRALLEELSGWYRRLAMGQSEHVLARWRRLSCLFGEQVRARVEGQVLSGTVAGICSTGELILIGPGGQQYLLPEERSSLLL
ncbi:MAG: biotin--[acetyl-CoA-carboxylase] ligase [Planctomycetota bacterium]|jgi:BirA family biotin operon repressor/biotin-[acetyl-CoA-carboxylase] ligase